MNEVIASFDTNWNWKDQYQVLHMPLSHGIGWFTMTQTVLNGATGVILRTGDVPSIYQAVYEYKVRPYMTYLKFYAYSLFQVQLLYSLPYILHEFYKNEKYPKHLLDSVKIFYGGGGPIKETVSESLYSILPNIKLIGQIYGLTETHIITQSDLNPDKKLRISVGKVVPNMEIKVSEC